MFGGSVTRWATRGSLPRIPEGNLDVTAPHKSLKLIAWGKLTFDERVELHRVDSCRKAEPVSFLLDVQRLAQVPLPGEKATT